MRKARRQASRGRRNSRIRLTDGIMEEEEEEDDDRGCADVVFTIQGAQGKWMDMKEDYCFGHAGAVLWDSAVSVARPIDSSRWSLRAKKVTAYPPSNGNFFLMQSGL